MLAIFAQRLTEPLFFVGKLIFKSPRCKRGSLQRTGESSRGDGISIWDPQVVVLQEDLESVHKCAVIFVIDNDNYKTWENDWHSWTNKMVISQEKEKRRQTHNINFYKGQRYKASLPTYDLIS